MLEDCDLEAMMERLFCAYGRHGIILTVLRV